MDSYKVQFSYMIFILRTLIRYDHHFSLLLLLFSSHCYFLFIPAAMLGTQLNDMVEADTIEAKCIARLEQYTCNVAQNTRLVAAMALIYLRSIINNK